MEQKPDRLYFIDAIRAWAILMMLQGHFVDGLLDPVFRDRSNLVYLIWEFFRGITAPVFFTVSGFIFTYLLIRVPQRGLDNPRVNKGLKRGLQLILIGYLLRSNLFGLLQGEIYPTFYLVDVLQCIGLSIIGIIGIYLLTAAKRKWMFPALLIGITTVLFFLEPAYKQWSYPLLPNALENYLTKVNGSVFTIIPWFGYSAFGAFLSVLFTRFNNARHLYPAAIGTALLTGTALSYSSPVFEALGRISGIGIFQDIFNNNYLFIRLGNVLVVFAIFMILRSFLKNTTLLRLGRNTLSIYVIHFAVLYGSLTGLGLYYYLHHSLSPVIIVPGAIAFMLLCSYAALRFDTHEIEVKGRIAEGIRQGRIYSEFWLNHCQRLFRLTTERLLRVLGFVKSR
jgi:uncharacterized membrane protein